MTASDAREKRMKAWMLKIVRDTPGVDTAEVVRVTGWLSAAAIDADLLALFEEGKIVARWFEGEDDVRFMTTERNTEGG